MWKIVNGRTDAGRRDVLTETVHGQLVLIHSSRLSCAPPADRAGQAGREKEIVCSLSCRQQLKLILGGMGCSYLLWMPFVELQVTGSGHDNCLITAWRRLHCILKCIDLESKDEQRGKGPPGNRQAEISREGARIICVFCLPASDCLHFCCYSTWSSILYGIFKGNGTCCVWIMPLPFGVLYCVVFSAVLHSIYLDNDCAFFCYHGEGKEILD